MADIAKKLREDADCLRKMVAQAGFAGSETGVRVKKPDLLLAVLDEAADALDAAHKRIAELEAALADTLHWLEVQHEWEPQDVRCKACAAITAGKALLRAPSRIDKEDRNG